MSNRTNDGAEVSNLLSSGKKMSRSSGGVQSTQPSCGNDNILDLVQTLHVLALIKNRTMNYASTRLTMLALAAVASTACGGGSSPGVASPRIVQPGAPGQSGRTFSTEELSAVEGVSYVEADVRFMQGMIPNHAHALEMKALVRQHASTQVVRLMGLRMEISQRDEIAMMQSWLRDHGEALELPGMGGMHTMPGMLTPEQMQALGNARGAAFDKLFLEGMIQHHLGALDMVYELYNTSGAAQESTVFKFAEDVDADQLMEIERMRGVLDSMR